MKPPGMTNRMLLEILKCAGRLRSLFFKPSLPSASEIFSRPRKIAVGPGPEDFVIDRWRSPPRLLVSCYDRRTGAPDGYIYDVDTVSEAAAILPRTDEPGRMVSFKPHGIDIRRVSGETLIYVILHDPYGSGRRSENAVGVYRAGSDRLQLIDFLEDPECLWSPNNLSVLDTGEIYLTNDVRGKPDLFLMRSVSEVVHYNPKTLKWRKVAGGIGFANGIAACTKRVYVVASYGNRVIAYVRYPDGKLGPGTTLVPLKGGDNLSRNENMLLAAAHFDYLAFLQHARASRLPSPSVVMQIDPENGRWTPFYVDSGETISAATTARTFKNRLYLSQAFNPFIIVADLKSAVPANA